MRPRFMNRGSNAAERYSGGKALPFNEAPIHESGKLLDAGSRRRNRVDAFNEAPIHESGK